MSYSYITFHHLLYKLPTGGDLCRGGNTAQIRIGPCKKTPERLGFISIPVGNTKKVVDAEVRLSTDGNTFDCIAVENFGAPTCPL